MDLLDKLPPFVNDPHYGRMWLTLGTREGGWMAAYLDGAGLAHNVFYARGRNANEAVLNLKENLDLLSILNAPAGAPEKVDEKKKP